MSKVRFAVAAAVTAALLPVTAVTAGTPEELVQLLVDYVENDVDHLDGGAVAGTWDYSATPVPLLGCRETVPGVSMRSTVVWTDGPDRYEGPLVFSPGTGALWPGGCDSALGGSTYPLFSASGTDDAGRRLECPRLGSFFVRMETKISGSFGGDCTLDGVALPLTFWLEATWVPSAAQVDADGIHAVTVAGAFTVSKQ